MEKHKYIIEYRKEFSTVVEAESPEQAMKKVRDHPTSCQWELIGNLWEDYLEHVSDHLTEAQLEEYNYTN